MAVAAVRVRGVTLAREDVVDTLRMLRLTRANHCVILTDAPPIRGMLRKVKDYVTWGEVSPQFVAKLFLKRGHVVGGESLTDSYVKAHSKHSSVWDLAQAIAKGEARAQDVRGLNPVLRLHPPIKGYKSVKLSFHEGGDLGDRGKEIENLLERMIGGEE